MNILHSEASPGWGGQEIRILREAEGMRSRGHSVIFAVMKGGGLVNEACKAGFQVYEIEYHKSAWPVTLFRLLAILRRHHIDLVNTHSSLDSWIAGAAARLSMIPIVRTRHLSTPVKRGLNSRLLYGALADFVVTTCSSIIPALSEQSGKLLDAMRCIATGVDPSRMTASEEEIRTIRRTFGIADGDFLIGTACFMRSWKGINDFLDAAERLQSVKNLQWMIIGGGHQDAYRQRAKERNLANVHFTGHLPNPIPAIAALDAFALLSTAHEGISQAILQAAYLAKPLIATPVGGLSEICLHRQTGLIVPPFSPPSVAEAVKELMQNTALRNELGQNARRLVEDHYTLQHTLDETEDVYRQILVEKNRID